MEPERWRRIDALFHAASGLPAAARAQLLTQSCGGDAELRAEVESLLGYDGSADPFIDTPAVDVAARLMAGDEPHADSSLSGTTVGNFRVLDKLGEGGMGVVYEAIDTRLGRTVALKFLPKGSSSLHARERFEREARAASALNHPNICTIYSVQDYDSQPFIEMERLEGQTLRERIKAHPLDLDEILATALQMVDGIEAAHAKGIVHRDLKPSNVLCTHRGTVKILDFGIAKLESAAGDDVGAGLGTVGYASPEQASGEMVDARTDLFSFGAVLYEMVTRQAAFQATSAASMRRAIVEVDPIAPRQLNPAVPVPLERIILKALRKDRGLRYQRASDLRADLKAVQQRAGWRQRPVLISAAVFLLLIAGALWYSQWRLSYPSADTDYQVRQLTHNTGDRSIRSAAISPDGESVAFTDPGGIHVRTIHTGETRQVLHPNDLRDTGSWELASGWFPDGQRFIANLRATANATDSTVWQVGVSSPPRKMREHAEAIAVSPDGSWIAFATEGAQYRYRNVWLIGHDGTRERKLFDVDAGGAITSLSWSPDGRRLAYIRANASGTLEAIEVRDIGGGAPSTVFRAVQPDEVVGAVWLPDGRLAYTLQRPSFPSSAGRLNCSHWQMRLDGSSGKPIGASNSADSWTGQCLSSLTFSADATRAIYQQWGLYDVIYLADMNADGHGITSPRRLTATDGRNIPSGWTADDTSLVFVSDGNGRPTLVRQSIGADTAQPIAFEPGIQGAARLTPDGTSVVYRAVPGRWLGRPRLMLVPSAGGVSREIETGHFVDGGARCAVVPATLCVIAEMSADGHELVFSSVTVSEGRGRELVRFNALDGADYRWALSPDGMRIALLNMSEVRIHVLALTGGSTHVDARAPGSLGHISWTSDGHRLLVPSVEPRGASLLSVDLQGNTHVLWQQPGAIDISGIPSRDGRRIAIWVRSVNANLWFAKRP